MNKYNVSASEVGQEGFTCFEVEAKFPHYAMECALESLGYFPPSCVSKMDFKRSSGAVAVYNTKSDRGVSIITVVTKIN